MNFFFFIQEFKKNFENRPVLFSYNLKYLVAIYKLNLTTMRVLFVNFWCFDNKVDVVYLH